MTSVLVRLTNADGSCVTGSVPPIGIVVDVDDDLVFPETHITAIQVAMAAVCVEDADVHRTSTTQVEVTSAFGVEVSA